MQEAKRRLTDSEIKDLIKRIKEGDSASHHLFIEAHMGLVCSRVISFVARSPRWQFYKDDLISVALVELSKVTNKIALGELDVSKYDSVVPYLVVVIDRRIRDAATKSSAISIPARTTRRTKLKQFKVEALPDLEIRDSSNYEIEDWLQTVLPDRELRKIVELTMQGMTRDEVADEMKISVRTVDARRKEIARLCLSRLQTGHTSMT